MFEPQARETRVSWFVAVLLALGILPSYTALSTGVAASLPTLAQYLGPLQPLKILSPALLAFIWIRRSALPRPATSWLLASLAIGTLCTWIAAVPCGYPITLLREWAAICLGFLSAAAFLLLTPRQQKAVLAFWTLAIFGSALLDFASPRSIDWLLSTFFDPQTRKTDQEDITGRVLTGIFGRQSLAKLLAWTPWVLAYFAVQWQASQRKLGALAALLVCSVGFVLATSQRGPFVGTLAGMGLFAAHQWLRLGRRRVATWTLASIFLSLAITVVVVPRPLLESRIKSLIGIKADTDDGRKADYNREFRHRMHALSLRIIASHPLGDACIPQSEFAELHIPYAHSHQLFLHQYRERGWLWGTLHLLLWLGAWLGAWLRRDTAGSCLLGGVTTIIVLGLVDHPWLVINQAVMLALILYLGLDALSKRPSRTAPPRSS